MKSSTLLALTASALALPGLHPVARADSPPAATTVSYRASSYQEDDLDAAKVLGGSTERYDITVNQLQLIKPIADKYSLTLTGSTDSMSGASPWYAVSQANGGAGIVMSGATIHEDRRDVNASVRRYLDNGTVGMSLSYSDENDYAALSGGVDYERHFNDNLTTLAGGVSFSSDDLSPTDAVSFNRVLDASKQSHSVFVALTQVLNQNSVVQTGLSVTRVNGYLSDPYKLFDIRPDSRSQIAWTTAWRQFIPAANAALHANYRYYHDNYGVGSHTAELSWFQNVGNNWQIVPGLRYYTQSAADFFTPASVFGSTLSTSADYRLSAYGAVSGSLKAQVSIDKFKFSLSGERYHSNEALGIFNDPSSPALVSFTRWSLGVDYEF
jgi:hypothetical protein